MSGEEFIVPGPGVEIGLALIRCLHDGDGDGLVAALAGHFRQARIRVSDEVVALLTDAISDVREPPA